MSEPQIEGAWIFLYNYGRKGYTCLVLYFCIFLFGNIFTLLLAEGENMKMAT